MYKTKYNSNGTIAHYKARLVAKVYDQEYEVNYYETFGLADELTTVCIFITIAINYTWPIAQLDILM